MRRGGGAGARGRPGVEADANMFDRTDRRRGPEMAAMRDGLTEKKPK